MQVTRQQRDHCHAPRREQRDPIKAVRSAVHLCSPNAGASVISEGPGSGGQRFWVRKEAMQMQKDMFEGLSLCGRNKFGVVWCPWAVSKLPHGFIAATSMKEAGMPTVAKMGHAVLSLALQIVFTWKGRYEKTRTYLTAHFFDGPFFLREKRSKTGLAGV